MSRETKAAGVHRQSTRERVAQREKPGELRPPRVFSTCMRKRKRNLFLSRFGKEPSRELEGTVTGSHAGLGTMSVPTSQTGKAHNSWGLG